MAFPLFTTTLACALFACGLGILGNSFPECSYSEAMIRFMDVPPFPDHYKSLNLPRTASPDEIENEFKAQVVLLQKTGSPQDLWNAERAHKVLSDEDLRKEYDLHLRQDEITRDDRVHNRLVTLAMIALAIFGALVFLGMSESLHRDTRQKLRADDSLQRLEKQREALAREAEQFRLKEQAEAKRLEEAHKQLAEEQERRKQSTLKTTQYLEQFLKEEPLRVREEEKAFMESQLAQQRAAEEAEKQQAMRERQEAKEARERAALEAEEARKAALARAREKMQATVDQQATSLARDRRAEQVAAAREQERRKREFTLRAIPDVAAQSGHRVGGRDE